MAISPEITIIVVAYNSESTIELCLKSIYAQSIHFVRYHVIVVDNHSTDQTAAIIRDKYHKVELITLQQNIGFGRANNLALEQAKTPYVALLNPDCELFENWLEEMLEFIQEDTAIVGSKLFYRNRHVLQHVGGVILPNGLTVHVGECELDIGQYDTPLEFQYVTGAALFCQRKILMESGNFDPRYFLYYEETDLCWRLIQAGYSIRYCPHAKAVHYEDKSLGHSMSTRYLYYYHKSRLCFVMSHSNREILVSSFYKTEKYWFQSIRGRHRWVVILCYILSFSMIIRALLNTDHILSWADYHSDGVELYQQKQSLLR